MLPAIERVAEVSRAALGALRAGDRVAVMPGEIKSLNVSNAAVLALYVGATRLGLMG